jgi:putative tryptophan/tyrosine transport system substrate-binding protein
VCAHDQHEPDASQQAPRPGRRMGGRPKASLRSANTRHLRPCYPPAEPLRAGCPMVVEPMRRREFITLVGGAAATWPLAARAQQSAMPVIGYFSGRSPVTDVPMLSAFREGFSETGFIEGRNVAIEFRWAEGRYERLPELVRDLVRRKVAVIVTSGGEASAQAAKAATSTIPIVFNTGGDPVEAGLLSELAPKAVLIGVLVSPENLGAMAESHIAEIISAGRAIGRQVITLKASTDVDIDVAFEMFIQRRVEALLVTSGPLFVTRMDRLVAFAARHALPAMYFRRELVDAGGLVSYTSSTAEGYRQMGIYAGRILKGEKPSELPVVQPTRFELVINLKTAKALGLTVPDTLLARADEVIE